MTVGSGASALPALMALTAELMSTSAHQTPATVEEHAETRLGTLAASARQEGGVTSVR